MKLRWAGVIQLAAVFSISTVYAARQGGSGRAFVMGTWGGDDPKQAARLGVNQIRMGCALKPEVCIQRATAAAGAEGATSASVSFNDDHSSWQQLLDSAGEYRKRVGNSATEGSAELGLVREISLDDFLRRLEQMGGDTASGGFAKLVEAALGPGSVQGSPSKGRADILKQSPGMEKAAYDGLRFGITLYEDELTSGPLNRLPAEVRARVGTVYLYLHYRKAAGDYSKFVEKTKKLFPQASVIGGVYAYDRMDYLRCRRFGAFHCSWKEELALFEQVTRIQAKLVKEGQLAGLEFYPGFFGREDTWPAWEKPRICAKERRAECIEQTKKLRESAFKILAEEGLLPQGSQ